MSKQHSEAHILPGPLTSAHGKDQTKSRPVHHYPRGNLFRSICYVLSIACSVYGILHILEARHGRHPLSDIPVARRLGPLPPNEHSDVCPQPQALFPSKHAELAVGLESVYADEEYKTKAYKALGGAIQIPYVVLFTLVFLCV